MKKIAKALLTLGVLAGLMVPAGLSAAPPTFVSCSMSVVIVLPDSIRVMLFRQEVPIQAASALVDAGWSCKGF